VHFYHDHPSLQMPRNNILVVLCLSSIKPTANQVLGAWVASHDSLTLYQRLIDDIQHLKSPEQLVLTLGALLCYYRLLDPKADANQPIHGSYQADFDAILNFEGLGNEQTVFERMVLSVLRIFWTVTDSEKMGQFLTTMLNIRPPAWDPSNSISDHYWTQRVKNRVDHRNALKFVGSMEIVTPARRAEEEEMAKLDDEIGQESEATTKDEDRVPPEAQGKELVAFHPDVFRLEPYKLVQVFLLNVPPNDKILTMISLPDGSWVLIVLGSYVSTLESNLGACCFPYFAEPSKEDVGVVGFGKAIQKQINALARMALDAMAKDDELEKGLWVYTDPRVVFNLLSTWLKEVVVPSEGDSPACPQMAGITSDPESGRIQLDGYNFSSYTLVRVSDLGQYSRNLDKLGNLDKVPTLEELPDESWELLVCKSYLPTLTQKLRKEVSDCVIEPGYNPLEPTAREAEELGYEKAKWLTTRRFLERAERKTYWPKAAAFYGDLIRGCENQGTAPDDDEKEVDMHGNEEQKEEIMVEDSISEGDWEML